MRINILSSTYSAEDYLVPAYSLVLTSLLLVGGATGQYIVQTIAGSDASGDGGAATAASLNQPEGAAIDAAGNLYIADAAEHRVRKVSAATGVIQTIAGTGTAGFSGDGGPGNQAQLNQPYGLALDRNGNLYIADLGNARVRRLRTDGVIETVAGGGTLPPGGDGDGGPATGAKLSAPRNVAIHPNGDLYLSDFDAHRVYRIAAGGILTTVAGNGKPGSSGDGGAGSLAQLAYPAGLAFDASGILYIADSANGRVRSLGQTIRTVTAGIPGPTSLAIGPDGTLYVAVSRAELITKWSAQVKLVGSRALAIAANGDLYAGAAGVVRRIPANSPPETVAGGSNGRFSGDGGSAVDARLNNPSEVAADASGTIYIADRNNNRIRRIGPDGRITTVAGDGRTAVLNQPSSVAVDASGTLWIADTGNNRILKLNAGGVPVVAADRLGAPSSIAAAPDGSLLIAEPGNNRISRLSGNSAPVPLAVLPHASAVAADPNGAVYASSDDSVVRIAPSGEITKISSRGGGLCADGAGNILIADRAHNQIWSIGPSGAESAIAGSGNPGFGGDGGPAANALFSGPAAIAIGPAGDFLVADTGNHRVRRLSLAPAAPKLRILHAATLREGPAAPGELVLIPGAGDPTQDIYLNDAKATVVARDPDKAVISIPSDAAPGSTLTLRTAAGTASLSIAAAAPGFFPLISNEDGTPNSSNNPALRGSTVVLYGTGFGSNTDGLTARVGDYPADILYFGNAPELTGVSQINLRLPAGYSPAGQLPLKASVGSTAAPDVLLFVR